MLVKLKKTLYIGIQIYANVYLVVLCEVVEQLGLKLQVIALLDNTKWFIIQHFRSLFWLKHWAQFWLCMPKCGPNWFGLNCWHIEEKTMVFKQVCRNFLGVFVFCAYLLHVSFVLNMIWRWGIAWEKFSVCFEHLLVYSAALWYPQPFRFTDLNL